MQRPSSSLALLGGLLLSLAAAPALRAQTARNYIASTGSDSNTGATSSPFRTFAGAFAKTNAGGEIYALDTADYGVLGITKSIRIDGGGGQTAVVTAVSGSSAITINAGFNDVVILRNLTITGGTYGVRVLGAKTVLIENCVISNATSFGIAVQPVAAGTTQVFLHDTQVRNCVGGCLYVAPAAGVIARVTADHCKFEDGNVGVLASVGTFVALHDSVIAGSLGDGVQASSNNPSLAAQISLDGCTIANHVHSGVRTQGQSAYALLKNNTITGNETGLDTSTGGAIISFGDNAVLANNPGGDGVPSFTAPKR